ncbi:MAG TPA: outer membrane beta-barrel protein, partial [Planctomycetota bacterium]|nr:outer membrane beta-barrel protein [Planctomycetota bacterium]
MRNLRALIACALGVLLVGSALGAADGDDSGVMARIAKLESDMKKVNDARGGGGGLGANQLPFIIDGFIDVTGNYAFNRSPSRTNLLRHYDSAADTFTLNVAHLAFHRDSTKASIVGFNVEIDMGEDARHDNGAKQPSGSTELFDVQEATIDLTIPGDENCGLVVGKFTTFEGIELIENTANPVISRGFLFMFAEPLTHVGFYARYSKDVNGKGLMFNVKLGAVNGWDLEADNNADKTFIWLLGVAQKGQFDVHFTGTWGDEQTATGGTTGHKAGNPRTSLDLTGFFVLDMLTLNFQVNGGQEKNAIATAKNVHWFGFALEPVVDFKNQLPGFKLGARFELFNDVDGARMNGLGTNEPQCLYNVTIAPAYTIRDTTLTIRGEYRYDASNLNRGQNARAFE